MGDSHHRRRVAARPWHVESRVHERHGQHFVGQTEAPLVVKPYIAGMTQSRLFAVMVGGLASVAGSALAGYALIGVPVEYLIAACFMSAPEVLLLPKCCNQKRNAQLGAGRSRGRRGPGERD